MLDPIARRLIDPPLLAMARMMSSFGIRADHVTVTGFALGVAIIPALALHWWTAALILFGLNRLADGLDGALARLHGPTDVGAYLDIVLDLIVYSGVVLGMALARPEDAVYAAFLIFCFIGTGASFLAYAIVAAKRNMTTEARGKKSIYYASGLAEGTETVVALCLMVLFPDWFRAVAVIFGVMCLITTASRIFEARATFRD